MNITKKKFEAMQQEGQKKITTLLESLKKENLEIIIGIGMSYSLSESENLESQIATWKNGDISPDYVLRSFRALLNRGQIEINHETFDRARDLKILNSLLDDTNDKLLEIPFTSHFKPTHDGTVNKMLEELRLEGLGGLIILGYKKNKKTKRIEFTGGVGGNVLPSSMSKAIKMYFKSYIESPETVKNKLN